MFSRGLRPSPWVGACFDTYSYDLALVKMMKKILNYMFQPFQFGQNNFSCRVVDGLEYCIVSFCQVWVVITQE